jgi:hypothetical protein
MIASDQCRALAQQFKDDARGQVSALDAALLRNASHTLIALAAQLEALEDAAKCSPQDTFARPSPITHAEPDDQTTSSLSPLATIRMLATGIRR